MLHTRNCFIASNSHKHLILHPISFSLVQHIPLCFQWNDSLAMKNLIPTFHQGTMFSMKATITAVCHSSPVGIFWLSHSLSRDGVLEDLSSVDFLLHTATCDEPVNHHILVLSNAECPVHSLGICGWIPAWIIWLNRTHRSLEFTYAY